MARITNRNFLTDFQTLEIEYGPDQKGPDVSDDIQMVHIMGDVTGGAGGSSGIPFNYENQIPTTIGNVYEVSTLEAGPLRPVVELVAGGRGIWLLAVLHSTATAANLGWWTLPAARIPALTRSFTPTQANSICYGDGGDSLSTFNVGDAAEDIPADVPLRIALIAVNGGSGQFIYNRGIFINPGQVVTQMRIGSNTDFPMGFRWRDIPPA